MRYLALTLVSLALLVPSQLNAQGRYSRGGSSWNGGGSRWNGGWGGTRGYYGNRYYNNSYGYGYRPTWSFGLGTTYYDSGYSSYAVPRTSYYLESNPITGTEYSTPPMSTATSSQARVELRLQNANDEVRVQGQLMPGTGLIRYFVSPELPADKEFVYTVTVRSVNNFSKKQDDQRTIDVKGGSNVVLDFTRPATGQVRNSETGNTTTLPLPR